MKSMTPELEPEQIIEQLKKYLKSHFTLARFHRGTEWIIAYIPEKDVYNIQSRKENSPRTSRDILESELIEEFISNELSRSSMIQILNAERGSPPPS